MNSFEINRIMRCYHYKFESGHVFTGHTHNEIEINIILSGKMNINIGEQLFQASEGEIYLSAPWVYHHNQLVGSSAEMLVIDLQSSRLSELFDKSWYAHRLDSNERALLPMLDSALCKVIEHWKGNRPPKADAERELPELGIMKRMLEILTIIAITSPCNLSRPSHRSSELCSEALSIMKARITQKLTITEIAAELHVSPALLKAAFTGFFGKGVIHYFTELKIGEARRLLGEGKSIQYVSDYLGFSSQSNFSMVFKRITGITPKKASRFN